MPIRLPDSVLAVEKPSDELEQRLSKIGFELSHWTREEVFFARGKHWGDWSTKYMPLRLVFPFPLTTDSEVRVEAADVCLFDTGDFWRLCHEIRDELAEYTG